MVICADSFNHKTTSLTGLSDQDQRHLLILDQVRMSLEMVRSNKNYYLTLQLSQFPQKWLFDAEHGLT